MSDDEVFSVYLGNIPADVLLEDIWINGKQLMSKSAEQGYSISPFVHANGSRAYTLQLPFEDAIVSWMVRTPLKLYHLLTGLGSGGYCCLLYTATTYIRYHLLKKVLETLLQSGRRTWETKAE